MLNFLANLFQTTTQDFFVPSVVITIKKCQYVEILNFDSLPNIGIGFVAFSYSVLSRVFSKIYILSLR